MIWIALGCLVLGLLVGGAGMRAAGRFARQTWRPAAGVLAVAAFLAAAFFGVREAWLAAGVSAGLGAWLALGARRRPVLARRPVPPASRMSADEARSILGVGPEAGPDEVQSAYLRLMRRAHPDQGGTSGLAAQLNAARETLTGR